MISRAVPRLLVRAMCVAVVAAGVVWVVVRCTDDGSAKLAATAVRRIDTPEWFDRVERIHMARTADSATAVLLAVETFDQRYAKSRGPIVGKNTLESTELPVVEYDYSRGKLKWESPEAWSRHAPGLGPLRTGNTVVLERAIKQWVWDKHLLYADGRHIGFLGDYGMTGYERVGPTGTIGCYLSATGISSARDIFEGGEVTKYEGPIYVQFVRMKDGVLLGPAFVLMDTGADAAWINVHWSPDSSCVALVGSLCDAMWVVPAPGADQTKAIK